MTRTVIAVIAAVFTLTTALSGCTSDEDAYNPDAAITNTERVDRVLVRGFLDPMDYGPGDEVFRVRVGGLTSADEGVPFDGFVIITLEPRDLPDEEGGDWIPRAWTKEVEEERFRDDTGLPYYEFTADGRFLEKGEPLLLTLEAQLADGRTLKAERETYA